MQSGWNRQLQAIKTYENAMGPSTLEGPKMAGCI